MKTKNYHFVDSSNNPFFWLADTAWNAALKGDEDEWHEYLRLRAQQGFTVIQFVTTQWRGAREPKGGRLFTTDDGGNVHFNEPAWKSMDRFIELIRYYGMIPAPIMLWANTPACPGQCLTENQAIEVCLQQMTRWSGGPTFWLLNGDGVYDNPQAALRWKRIGRVVHAQYPSALIGLHPCGLNWPTPYFMEEPWLGFSGLQSGHGIHNVDMNFLVNGPIVRDWRRLRHPIVNLEPNYEHAIAYATDFRISDRYIRRAAWWSVLLWPCAGVTYGNNAIWIWGHNKHNQAEDHDPSWNAPHWRMGLQTKGIEQMGILKQFLTSLDWSSLRPCQDQIVHQPGKTDPSRWIAIAANATDTVAYLPVGSNIEFRNPLPYDAIAQWFNPMNAQLVEALPRPSDPCTFSAPDQRDWILWLHARK